MHIFFRVILIQRSKEHPILLNGSRWFKFKNWSEKIRWTVCYFYWRQFLQRVKPPGFFLARSAASWSKPGGLGFPLSFRNPYWAGGEHMTGSVDLWNTLALKKIAKSKKCWKTLSDPNWKMAVAAVADPEKGIPVAKASLQTSEPGSRSLWIWDLVLWPCAHVAMGMDNRFFSADLDSPRQQIWYPLVMTNSLRTGKSTHAIIGKASISMGHPYHGYVKEGRYR